MTKAELKAKRKANRSMKRQQEHKEKVEQAHSEAVKEKLRMKNKYGKPDPTAYYAIRNMDRPSWQHEYGF